MINNFPAKFDKFIKIFLIAWIFLNLTLFSITASPIVISDGYCYYHIARSIVDEGSFVSQNKPDYYDYRGHVIAFDGEVYKDVCSPGTAFALVPGLSISKLVNDQTTTQYNDYFESYSGHSLADGIAILITAMVFAIISFYYLYQLIKLLIPEKKYSLLLTIAITSSAYLVNYIFIKPFYTHIYEFFAAIIFIYNITKFEKKPNNKNIIAAAVAISFGFTVRPFFVLPAVMFALWLILKKQWKFLLTYCLANLPFILMWMGYNQVSYGKLIASGYNEIRGETFTFEQFNLISVLFSPWRGWLINSPFVIVAFIGYALKLIKKTFSFFDAIMLSNIAFVILSYSFWPAWWGGGSYGARFMIINVPFLIYGFISAFNYLRNYKEKIALLTFTIIATTFTTTLSLLFLITPNNSPKNMLLYLFKRDSSLPIIDERYKVDSEFGLIDILTGRARAVVKIDDRYPDKINFLALDYHPGQYSKPEVTDIYVKDVNTNITQVFSFDISSLDAANPVYASLEISDSRLISSSSSLELKETITSRIKYSNFEYEMFVLDEKPYIIFMSKLDKLKLIGPNKTGEPEKGYYE